MTLYLQGHGIGFFSHIDGFGIIIIQALPDSDVPVTAAGHDVPTKECERVERAFTEEKRQRDHNMDAQEEMGV